MNEKSFIKLAVVTGVFVVAALASLTFRYTGPSPERVGVAYDPGFSERADDVAEIFLRSGENAITVVRQENGWGLKEKNGYPVRDDRVRTAIAGLVGLSLLDPKTSRPDRHHILQVENPESEGAKSVLAVFRDGEGNEISSIIAGKRKFSYAQSGAGGIYVRRPLDDQAWLASGEFGVSAAPDFWLKTGILHIAPERVARMTFSSAEGEDLVISKDDPGAARFVIESLPDDAVLRDDTLPEQLSGAFGGLTFVDVLPAEKADFFSGNLNSASVRTFGGNVVSVDLANRDGRTWARFKVTSDGEEGLSKEAKALNDRLEGWVYELHPQQSRTLQTRLKDLLQIEDDLLEQY